MQPVALIGRERPMNYFQMVNEAIALIEEERGRNLSVAEIAERYDISRFYFSRIFKALTKQNVKEYLDGRRMAAAVAQLAATRRRILDIALDCGYESHAVFTRKFKQCFGITPAQFRKSGGELPVCPRLAVVERQFKNLHRQLIVDFERQSLGPLRLVGQSIRFNPDREADLRRVKAFYGRFTAEYLIGKGIDSVYNVTGSEARPGDRFDYFAGFPPPAGAVPDGLVPLTLPASDYAVFRYKNSLEGIHRTVAGDVWTAVLLSGLTLNRIGIHFFELYQRGYERTKQFLLYVPVRP
ncbi:AraC family transcriptional regulator [Hydrogenispora ethanolica]|uniref:AraC family transcriptional regulator n=2 Tax=Hydrogenispora ethanolica TaxID=1082276 RepID=A0A4R1SBP8_HYDET|nr:AraC family transcriptional regulator [Hydrogenispora ethanolica]